MKVVGGTGLISSKAVAILPLGGPNVFTASPNTGTLRARITQGRLTTRWSRPGQLRRNGSKIGSKRWPGGSSRGR
jgi:hypothetical protein